MRDSRIQADYYTRTADGYDNRHVADDDEHGEALRFIAALCEPLGARSFLDIGAGTGRGMLYLRGRGFEVHGIEPVEALRKQALAKGVDAAALTAAAGEALPFPDNSFDVVFETGVLHHVRHPAKVVSEMCRVARVAVFLSDENRFAFGSPLRRAAVYALYRLGLFGIAYRIYTRGRGYRWSEGDGLAYSYSVYDNLPQLSAWSDRAYAVPLKDRPRATFFQPLFTHFHVLLVALRTRA